MIALALFLVGALFMAWCMVMLVRVEFIYRARCWFLDNDIPTYLLLPSFGSMLESPRFITLWTVGHWRTWVARQRRSRAP